ncbi:glycosyltransferase [Bacteroides fragilis]|uniref:glycosyltransferase n=1 Tax=Bacteroides fragilis TaxID=817 RepID=UPI0022AAED27|nr:glycosyltransferase [Bacteroides fragilis]MCZ2614366.1 glycosyltransferase [Bacteroides fragilis]MCZ2625157.1 glycosyltransferase [Bacteroides fragilis]
MKLLQINSVVNTGSTGRIVEDIALLAMKNGWESYVAYGRNSQESQSETIRVGNCFDKVCHGIGTRLFDRHGLVSRAATKILIRKIKKMKPDIIHIHNIHGYYLNYPLLFNYLSDSEIPVVWTLHDCWSFTGHCTYFSFIGCDRWRTGCFSCPQKKKYPGSLYVDRSYKTILTKELILIY